MIHHFHTEALREGFEPTTNRLTVYCSTAELTEQIVRTGFYFYRLYPVQSGMNYQIDSNGLIHNILWVAVRDLTDFLYERFVFAI